MRTALKRILAMTVAAAVMAGTLSGCNAFGTVIGMSENKGNTFTKESDLENGKAYVLSGDTYYKCIAGDINFNRKELDYSTEHPRSIWIDSDKDKDIPTVKKGDDLIFVSEESVPEEIVFERFADYGYSIGVSNMLEDLGGHYYIDFAVNEDDDYKYFLDLKSDAAEVSKLAPVERLYLDKVGGVSVDKRNVTEGGTVAGLEKDKTYTCEFYTGTYYQDFNLKASIHSFSSFERFVSHDYEFVHSNYIKIKLPEYFVSGYYYVLGVGLFRYVSESDVAGYNGESYDASIDWNKPLITYNEDGTVKYDPSDPDNKKNIDKISDPGIKGDLEVSVPKEADEGTDNRKEQDNGGS